MNGMVTPEGVRVAGCKKLIENNFDVEKTVGWLLEHHNKDLCGRLKNKAVIARRVITMGGTNAEFITNVQAMREAMRQHIETSESRIRDSYQAEIDLFKKNTQEDRGIFREISRDNQTMSRELVKTKDEAHTWERRANQYEQLALGAGQPEPPSPAPPPTPPSPSPIPQEPEEEEQTRPNFHLGDYLSDERVGR